LNRQFIWLRLAIFICYSTTAYKFHTYSNATFSVMFSQWSIDESLCETVVQGSVGLLILSSLLVWNQRKYLLWLSCTGALAILIDSLAYAFYMPYAMAPVAPMEQALRYMPPVALCFYGYGHYKWGTRLLIVATSFTFAAHGMKALWGEPVYVDYLLVFFEHIKCSITPSIALCILHIIGTIDIALSHHLCFFKSARVPWVLRYMFFWGLVTALVRGDYAGFSAWHEVLLRAPHALVPLFLLITTGVRYKSPNKEKIFHVESKI
jgi:hypothetical protein